MEPDFNVENAAADIASDLGFGSEESAYEEPAPEIEAAPEPKPAEQADPYVEPPKSWKK